MNAALVSDPAWSRQRWVWTLLAVFTLQLTLILALGRHTAPPPRPPGFTPVIAAVPERVALWPQSADPTFLARPHPRAFAGGTWLRFDPPSYDAADLMDQPEVLEYAIEDAGRAYLAAVNTNAGGLFELVARPPLEPGTPTIQRSSIVSTEPSHLRIEGDLRQRPLISNLELPAWRHNQVLRPTVLQVTVDGRGRTVSAFVTESSGVATADDRALELARTAEFAPASREGPGRVTNPNEGILWGRMIFDWRTLPPSSDAGAVLTVP